MVGFATVLQEVLQTAVEILAPFHLSITTMPIQSLPAPQAEQSMILETEKDREISPAMNSGLSPPAA